MPAETDSLLNYWPTGAYAVALIAVVFAAGWLSVAIKRFRRKLAATGESKRLLTEARAMSKDNLAKLKTRQSEMDKLNDKASKLFWRNEKTWIG
ncbi:MAG: hypothetical protein QM773_17485 [Hyphomonadaceae bacterium]